MKRFHLEFRLEPQLGGRFALFGHSMGALRAFEIARKLQARGASPEVLFVSGEPAPHLPTEWENSERELWTPAESSSVSAVSADSVSADSHRAADSISSVP
jgi:surfactin synthase thioesterase subunit